MHTRRMARSRRAAYYLGTDEQQKRLDQLPWCNWLRFTQKVSQKGKAARFMKTGTSISFASRRQGRNIP